MLNKYLKKKLQHHLKLKKAIKRAAINAEYVLKKNLSIIPRIFLLRNISP